MLEVSGSRKIADPFYVGVLSPLPQQTVGKLGASSSFEAAVIRLLMGAANVCDATGKIIVAQRVNYLILGAPRFTARTVSGVNKNFSALGLSWRDVDRHLKSSLAHQSYYKEILLELSEYFVRTKRGDNTLAFLHAYRLLERMSFVFPLLFAVRSANYPKAFSVLKEYFKGGVESELALIRKFQGDALERSLREAPAALDFGVLDVAYAQSSFDAVKRCVPQDPGVIVSDVFPHLVIQSQALLPLLINLRNRYFHYSVSNEANISLGEVGDSDRFFGVLNRSVVNWLGVVFFATLSSRIS